MILEFNKAFNMLMSRKKTIHKYINLEYSKEYYRLMVIIDELQLKMWRNQKCTLDVIKYFEKGSTNELRELFANWTSYNFEDLTDYNALELFETALILEKEDINHYSSFA